LAWNLQSGSPIYLQIADILLKEIVVGRYKPGDTFPSVRDLSAEAQVNPNTMQRALHELEQKGLLTVNRTGGRYVTEDNKIIERLKEDMAKEKVEAFIREMKSLGIDSKTILELLQRHIEEEVYNGRTA